MSYDNTNSGFLATNKRREKDTHPTHQGSINIEGKEYWLSAWVNTGKEGGKLAGQRYFSIKVKPKEQKSAATTGSYDWREAEKAVSAEKPKEKGTEDFNDDIPF